MPDRPATSIASSDDKGHGGPAGRLLRRFGADASGATAIEYCMITGLIFVAIVGVVQFYADQVGNLYTIVSSALSKLG